MNKAQKPDSQMKSKCPVCRGTGQVQTKTKDGTKTQACLKCRGTGMASGGYITKVPRVCSQK